MSSMSVSFVTSIVTGCPSERAEADRALAVIGERVDDLIRRRLQFQRRNAKCIVRSVPDLPVDRTETRANTPAAPAPITKPRRSIHDDDSMQRREPNTLAMNEPSLRSETNSRPAAYFSCKAIATLIAFSFGHFRLLLGGLIMSAIGTKRTSLVALQMSAYDPETDRVHFPDFTRAVMSFAISRVAKLAQSIPVRLSTSFPFGSRFAFRPGLGAP